MGLKKTYVIHEDVYRDMKKRSIRSWNQRTNIAPVEPATLRFLQDVLEQPWLAKRGHALELGCGTAPILHWLHTQCWSGVGVDISKTAIAMARQQSLSKRLKYHVDDVTRLSKLKDESFDLAIDGQCLHCLTDLADRTTFFKQAHRVLKPNGCLVIMTMSLPILPTVFRKMHGVIRKNIIYRESSSHKPYHGQIDIKGIPHIPVRFLENWRTTLKNLEKYGLFPKLIRVNLPHEKDPLSYLCVAAIKTDR